MCFANESEGGVIWQLLFYHMGGRRVEGEGGRVVEGRVARPKSRKRRAGVEMGVVVVVVVWMQAMQVRYGQLGVVDNPRSLNVADEYGDGLRRASNVTPMGACPKGRCGRVTMGWPWSVSMTLLGVRGGEGLTDSCRWGGNRWLQLAGVV